MNDTIPEVRDVIGGYVVPCARCGVRKVVAADAVNSDLEVCGRCGIEIGLHELTEQGEPTDAQVRAVWDALGPAITVAFEYEELRAALHTAFKEGESR